MPNSRRRFLRRLLAGAALAGVSPSLARAARFGQSPAIVTSPRARPQMPYGIAAGDVAGGRAIVWSATDRPARMIVEWDTTDRFTNARRLVGPAALEPTAFTTKIELTDLPAGQRIAYRVQYEGLRDLKALSEPRVGSFATAPATATRPVRVAWTADVVGQGWGRNPDFGGLKMFETMRRAQPDLFIHSGDTVYADQPLAREVTLDDGTVWRNIVTEAKSHVAQTLEDYRGNHRYNLEDAHVQRFAAEVAQVYQWDDHEVLDNWYPTEVLTSPRFAAEKSVALLAAWAKQAFLEHYPIRIDPADPERIYRQYSLGPLVDVFVLDERSYRGANSPNTQTTLDAASALLGAEQLAWLKRGLARSQATWKIVASDLPLGVVVPDYPPPDMEAFAQGDGAPLGRELELADLFRHLKANRVRNVVWITADVHYCAAHEYHPSRARFTEFDPFWEFVAGPAHAGTFGPNAMDDTFGPEVKFVGIPPGMKPNRPPSEGLQFFGVLEADPKTRALTVRLHNLAGNEIYKMVLGAEC